MKDSNPEPGLYKNVSDEEYHSWPYVSATKLKALNYSPKRCKWMIDNPKMDTPALKLGRVYHDAILRPDVFAKNYVVSQPCAAVMQSGMNKGMECKLPGKIKVDGIWKCGKHAPRGSDMAAHVITQEDRHIAQMMVASVRSDPQALELIQGNGFNEAAFVWDDPDTGLRCKSKNDRFTEFRGRSCHVDLKGVASGRGSASAFGYDALKFGYDIQDPLYRMGARAMDRLQGVPERDRMFVFIVIEKGDGYPVGCYQFTPDSFESGERKVRRLLRKYKECMDLNNWPGYTPDGIGYIDVPTYGIEPFENGEIPS